MTHYTGEHRMLISAAETTTRFRETFPALGRAALLTHKDRRAIPMRYVAATTPPSKVNLVHYEPDDDPTATKLPLPGLYQKVTRTRITAAGAELLKNRVDYRLAHPAVVWRLADAAMVGTMTEAQVRRLLLGGERDPETDGKHEPYLNMLLGGGKEGLDTGLGVYYPSAGTLVSSPEWVAVGATLALQDFTADELIF